jgi:hypothetical protein
MSKPRRVNPDERLGWFAQVKDGDQNPPDFEDLETLRRYVANQNPLAWYRYKKYHRKVGKILSKIGMNPEDARWLL